MAQSNVFDLGLDGKKIGTSSYTLEPVKGGIKMVERGRFRLGGADTDTTDEFKYSDTYSFLDGSAVDHNTNLQSAFVPSKARDIVTLGRVLGGAHQTNIAQVKPDLILLTPFDAGAVQAALLFVKAHPTEKNTYSLLIPGGGAFGGGGGGGGRRGGGGETPEPGAAADGPLLPPNGDALEVVMLQGKDTSGSIGDGKPFLLHTYVLGAGKMRIIMYADEKDQLMLVNAPAFHASYVRQNFKINMGTPSQPPAAAPLAKP